MAEAFHDRFEVGSADEQPGCVGVPEVVHSDVEVETRGFYGGQPIACPEGVAAKWSAPGLFGRGKQ